MKVQDYLDSRTDEELMQEFEQLRGCIEVFECFGTSDLVLYQAIGDELIKRGYEYFEDSTIKFVKNDE